MYDLQKKTVDALVAKRLFDVDFPVATDDELLEQAKMYLQEQNMGLAVDNFRSDYIAQTRAYIQKKNEERGASGKSYKVTKQGKIKVDEACEIF